jgi:hypothetical protein
MICYENNVSQRKYYVRELEPSVFIKELLFLRHNTPKHARFPR